MSAAGKFRHAPSVNISSRLGSRGRDLHALILRHVSDSRARGDRDVPVFHMTAAQYEDVVTWIATRTWTQSVGDTIYGLPLSRICIIESLADIVPDVARCVEIDREVARREAETMTTSA